MRRAFERRGTEWERVKVRAKGGKQVKGKCGEKPQLNTEVQ